MTRVIGHLDLDYFYAQVEEVEDSSLRGRPVIVCVFSGRTEVSGVVSTANYVAREMGIRSGMPIAMAKKKLDGRDPAIIRMDHEKYEAVSGRVMGLLEKMVDTTEQVGIDEAFFDLTTSTGGDYSRAAEASKSIKESIFKNEHLTCSIGLGRSKVVAKLCSDLAKPGGLKAVLPGETEAFLSSIPVIKLYGVGPKTAGALEEMGVKVAGDLSRIQPSELEARFGRKFGAYLLEAATGTDSEPVVGGLEPTQFSRILTLKRDTHDPSEVVQQLAGGLEYIHGKLVSSGKSCKTLTAIGILADLSTKTKSRTFETPNNDPATLKEAAVVLFQELTEASGKDLRRAGVRASGLVDVENQSSLSDFLRPAE